MTKRIPISASIISKNDPFLETCLQSIRDHVDEIVVVDTGSTDPKCIEIAQKYADKFEIFTACNDPQTGLIEDFSMARQRSFDIASNKACIWLDSDDTIENPELFQDVLNKWDSELSKTGLECAAFLYPYEYSYDMQGRCNLEHYRERLFTNKDMFRWVSSVHETCCPKDNVRAGLFPIDSALRYKHHRQYVPKQHESGRNLRILKKYYEKVGDSDARQLYYLGLEYCNMGFIKESIDHLVKYIGVSGWEDERVMACIKLVDIFQGLGQYDEGLRWAFKAVEIKETWAEGYFCLARMFYFLALKGGSNEFRNWEKCIYFAKQGLSLPTTKTLLFINPMERECEIYKYLNLALNKTGRVEEALEAVRIGMKRDPNDPSFVNNKKLYEDFLSRAKIVEQAHILKSSGVVDQTGLDQIQSIINSQPLKISFNLDNDLNAVSNPMPDDQLQSMIIAIWKQHLLQDDTKSALDFLSSVPNNVRSSSIIQEAKELTKQHSLSLVENESFIPVFKEDALDIIFYAGDGVEIWTPKTVKKTGIGGSELMLLEQAKRLAALGHKVRVFNSCGSFAGNYDGVEYHQSHEYHDLTCDILVVSRYAPALGDNFNITAKLKLLWVHDVFAIAATNELLLKADRILALSNWHRDFLISYHNVHPDQIITTRNAIDMKRFENKNIKRNKYKCVNSSSPDRSYPALLNCWPKIKEQVLEAELHLYYGFKNWKAYVQNDQGQLNTIAQLEAQIKNMASQGVIYHDRVNQKQLAEEFLGAGAWIFSTWFSETSCISAMEAQAAGLRMVCSNLAALKETAGMRASLIDGDWMSPEYQAKFIEEVVKALRKEDDDGRLELQKYAQENFGFDDLAKDWEHMFYSLLEEIKTDPTPPYIPTAAYKKGNYSQPTKEYHHDKSKATIFQKAQLMPKNQTEFPIAKITHEEKDWHIPSTYDFESFPIKMTEEQLQASVIMIWKQYILHDEIKAAINFLENAPYVVRHTAATEKALKMTKDSIAWISDPSKVQVMNSPEDPNMEIDVPLPGELMNNQSGQRFRAITDNLPKDKSASIIDFGCVEGCFTNRYGLLGHKVIGLDLSEQSVALANKKAIEFNTGAKHIVSHFIDSANKVEHNSMDYATSTDTYEHLLDPIKEMLLPAKKMLKSDGTFLMMTPYGAWMRGNYIPWAMPWQYKAERNQCWLDPKNPRNHIIAPSPWSVAQDFRNAGYYVKNCYVKLCQPFRDVEDQGNVFVEAKIQSPKNYPNQDIVLIESQNCKASKEYLDKQVEQGNKVRVYKECGKNDEGIYDGVEIYQKNKCFDLECDILISEIKSDNIQYKEHYTYTDKEVIKKIKPSISILMPTNRIGGLDLLFKSLEKQTVQDFELVLSDSLYQYRKELIAQKAKNYKFSVKHIEPLNNTFPEPHLCSATNTGFVNCSSDLVLMITDYTYLPENCVERHIAFHNANPAENIGYMCPHQYRSLPELHPEFPTYQEKAADQYAEDLKSKKLNNLMWSIFKSDFDQDPETLPLDSMGNADNKLTAQMFSRGDYRQFNGKNESLKLSAALKVNGYDEDLDGATPYQDNVFSDLLERRLGFIWVIDSSNKAYIINPRFVMPHSKRLRTPDSNYAIWLKKQANNFDGGINTWQLEEAHKVLQEKPLISVIIPTNRIGGLDILFEGLKKQSYKNFELILVDAIFEKRKNIVAEKTKQYNFTVKHIEPNNNDFPISNYCKSINTALCVAKGSLVYFTCDYSYLHKDTLLTHAMFHINKPENVILCLPTDYYNINSNIVSSKFLSNRQYGNIDLDIKHNLEIATENEYTDTHNKWSENYVEDINNGLLDNYLWSIFNDQQDMDLYLHNSKPINSNVLGMTIEKLIPELCCLKNDSFKFSFLLKANGLNEELDGSHGYQDAELARRLTTLYDGQFYGVNKAAASIFNIRQYLEPRKIINGYNNRRIIDKNQYNQVELSNNTITKFKQNNQEV